MEYKDYYSILGVDKKATADAIKHAYRRLARKYHPDVSKEANAEEKFKDLQEAYEVLKDPEKRNAYDQLGSQWKAGQEFRTPPGWESYQHFYTGNEQEQFGGAGDFGGFSDFFANLFGGGREESFGRGREEFGRGQRRAPRQRGADQQAKVNISLEEAFRGTSRTFQLQMPDTGEVKTIKVTIPPGSLPGQKLRLTGQGGPGYGGGPSGDLYLEIEIGAHPYFSLEGKDVYLTLPVTPWEAALGSDIKTPTLAGPVGLKIAPGSQSGQKLRLKGRGMPAKPTPGDQYAILQIKTPAAHDQESRALYEKMAQLMPFNPRKDWAV